jgi:hypothetical protein
LNCHSCHDHDGQICVEAIFSSLAGADPGERVGVFLAAKVTYFKKLPFWGKEMAPSIQGPVPETALSLAWRYLSASLGSNS